MKNKMISSPKQRQSEPCPSELQLDLSLLQKTSPHQEHTQSCSQCQKLVNLREKHFAEVSHRPDFEAFAQSIKDSLALSSSSSRFQKESPEPHFSEKRATNRMLSIKGWGSFLRSWPKLSWVAASLILFFFASDLHRLEFTTRSPQNHSSKSKRPGKNPAPKSRKRQVSIKRANPRMTPISKRNPPGLFVPKNALHVRLLHYAKNTQNSRLTSHLEKLAPGTFIQFDLRVFRKLHLMIASINQKGEISLFVPLEGQKSLLVSSGVQPLPANGSLELDKYLGLERIFVAVSLRSFHAGQLKTSMKKAFHKAKKELSKMSLLEDFRVVSFLIQKVPSANKQ